MTTSDTTAPTAPSTRRGALHGAILVAVGLGVAQVTSYLLSLVAARRLGPEIFGAFASMLALILVGNVLALGLQATGARRIVQLPDADRPNGGLGIMRESPFAGFVVAGLTVLIAPLLDRLLHLDGLWPVLLVAACLYPATLFGGLLGITQGHESHARLATMCALQGSGRAVGGVTALFLSPTLNAALIGMLVGSAVAAFVGWLVARRLTAAPPAQIPDLRREVIHDTHALFVLFVLTNIDVLLARHFLPATQAGMYAAGSIVAKVMFWLPQFVATVAYPRLADHRREATLLKASAAVFAIGAVATAAVAMLPNLVVALVGGQAYSGLASDVWIFAASGSAYALAQFLLYGQLAASKRSAIAVLWLAVLTLVGLVAFAFHSSVLQIVTTVLGVASTVAVVGLTEVFVERHRSNNRQVAHVS